MAGTATILKKVPIPVGATAGQTSTVGEPSLANRGNDLLFSGNWYAASSANGGTSWSAINPFTFFPAAAGGFCCDQTLHYDVKNDLAIWLLQYVKAADTNVLRIAVKKGPFNTPGGWRWWDLGPVQVDPAWVGEWFDYNHAALSDNFLYVGTNSFSVADNQFKRCVVFRISLASLVAGAQLSISRFSTTNNFSLRCVQGAKAIMYFASHESNTGRAIRVFSWPENAPTVTSRLVNITAWNPPPFSAPVANGVNWLQRADGRITGAALGGAGAGTLSFMWTAAKQGTQRPFPFVRVVQIDAATMAVTNQPDIWSGSTAFAYPDACPNANGVVGVTVFSGGGGNNHPAHHVGFRDDAASQWKLALATRSTHSPKDQKWGDYLTCRTHSPEGQDWIASGFTLQGGDQRSNVVPQYVHFGIR